MCSPFLVAVRTYDLLMGLWASFLVLVFSDSFFFSAPDFSVCISLPSFLCVPSLSWNQAGVCKITHRVNTREAVFPAALLACGHFASSAS